ncbi:MAG: hypothetical protein CMJ39_11585 [Phycisphaerae bacterium]|nr:hypothetical protein [Phycisphaerae bacterium]
MNQVAVASALLVMAFHGTSTIIAGTIHVPDEHETIQGAIEAASDGDTILVAPGIYTGSGDWVINTLGKAIVIRATDTPEDTILNGEGLRRVLHFANNEQSNTIIEGFMITGGQAETGGGVYCYSSSPLIKDCLIVDNTADVAGGGIHCEWYSSPVINGCDINNNAAGGTSGRGGGIACIVSSPVINTCQLFNNIASGDGGAASFLNCSPNMINCVISENSAGSDGGGLYSQDSSLILDNCTVTYNTASMEGGGIYFGGSFNLPMFISYCTITDNTTNIAGGGILGLSNLIVIANTFVCSNEPDQIQGQWTDKGLNSIEDECSSCPGDANGDGHINVNDVLYALSAWDSDDPNADFDDNGIVNVDDVLILLSQFGQSCP